MGTCKAGITKVRDVSEATTLVMDWFERYNRPATPQSLTDALGSRVAKPLLQKILDQLHAEAKLHVKDAKKTRFYYLRVLPPLLDPDGVTTEQHVAPEEEAVVPAKAEDVTSASEVSGGSVSSEGSSAHVHAALLNAVALSATQLHERGCRLARWRVWPSHGERRAKRADLELEICRLRESIERFQSRHTEEPAQAHGGDSWAWRARSAVCRYRRARRHWVQRKDWAMRLLEATAGEGHTPVQAATLLGCTTDTEAGVSLEDTAVVLPPPLLRELGLSLHW
ncbi:hypothetical protein JKF63_04961 [Porcisia hertigi]|uniref:Homologous-pairing protein 2 winged helix domain-containing protein n=1 Tax=Porcisia hertigi TaxID=2761500 RepID=A0A836I3T2_9TRYP|nr:hypothetical protein JKF63_04961 [Porcisia hertigi]